MRAAVVEELGEPPVLRELPEPEREAGSALVEVTAAPLNPIDISIGSGRFYAGRPQPPYVPGREGVGRVLAGERLAVGTRVWFTAPGGLGGSGSLCERAATPEVRAVELSEDVADGLAASLGVAGLAAWLALERRARLHEGESVLVLGASGAVGQVAVQAAKLMGARRVVAAARSAEGLARARELGADATVALGAARGPEALAEDLRGAAGGGVDVTLDPLWGEPAVAAVHAAAPGGRIVQVGQSAGAEARIPSAAVRGKMLAILGHANLTTPREEMVDCYRRMLAHAAAGRLTLDHELVPLERVADAWRRQQGSPGRKLVLRP